jgi:hypothetical protein
LILVLLKKDNAIEFKKKEKYDWNEFKIRDKDFYGNRDRKEYNN